MVSPASQTSPVCSAPATTVANGLPERPCVSAAQGGSAACQRPWLLSPLLDVGEIPHWGVRLSEQPAVGLEHATQKCGAAHAGGKQKLRRELGGHTPSLLLGWTAQRPTHLEGPRRAEGHTGPPTCCALPAGHQLTLFPPSPASVSLSLTFTALGLHRLTSFCFLELGPGHFACVFPAFIAITMSFPFSLIMQGIMSLLGWKTRLHSWHKTYLVSRSFCRCVRVCTPRCCIP